MPRIETLAEAYHLLRVAFPNDFRVRAGQTANEAAQEVKTTLAGWTKIFVGMADERLLRAVANVCRTEHYFKTAAVCDAYRLLRDDEAMSRPMLPEPEAEPLSDEAKANVNAKLAALQAKFEAADAAKEKEQQAIGVATVKLLRRALNK